MVVVEVAGIPLEINIVGNDGPFPEYDDPDACETSPVGSKKTKNVESRADTSFAVRFSLGETPTKTGLDFETDLELDGKKVEELVFSEQDLVLGSMKVDSYIAFQNGKSVEQKFFFRKLPVGKFSAHLLLDTRRTMLTLRLQSMWTMIMLRKQTCNPWAQLR
jgi:hypothetical protein